MSVIGDGDAIEPRGEFAAIFETAEMRHRLEQDFLRGIFRHFPPPDHPERKIEDSRLVVTEQSIERREIVGLRRGDEFGVGDIEGDQRIASGGIASRVRG